MIVTTEAMNKLGLDVSSVGNHEFDEGYKELQRLANGGCLDDGAGAANQDSCPGGKSFAGASFPILAANVRYKATGQTILPATWVKKFKGAKIGFIGMTLASVDPDRVVLAQGGDREEIVLTVPASFDEEARELTVEAARSAETADGRRVEGKHDALGHDIQRLEDEDEAIAMVVALGQSSKRVPTVFGMNFQAVSVGQKLKVDQLPVLPPATPMMGGCWCSGISTPTR